MIRLSFQNQLLLFPLPVIGIQKLQTLFILHSKNLSRTTASPGLVNRKVFPRWQYTCMSCCSLSTISNNPNVIRNTVTGNTEHEEDCNSLDINVEDFAHLTEQEKHKLQVIEMEYVMSKQSGGQVPEKLNNEIRLELLSMETRSKRSKYLR